MFNINSFLKTGGRMAWLMGHNLLISDLTHRSYIFLIVHGMSLIGKESNFPLLSPRPGASHFFKGAFVPLGKNGIQEPKYVSSYDHCCLVFNAPSSFEQEEWEIDHIYNMHPHIQIHIPIHLSIYASVFYLSSIFPCVHTDTFNSNPTWQDVSVTL